MVRNFPASMLTMVPQEFTTFTVVELDEKEMYLERSDGLIMYYKRIWHFYCVLHWVPNPSDPIGCVPPENFYRIVHTIS